MKIGLVLRELHHRENELAHLLLRVGERHRTDHEIFHLSRDLAGWSRDHVRGLAEAGTRYHVELDPEVSETPTLAERLRERGSEIVGRAGQAELLLLRDLREIYTEAAGLSVDWELLGQAAQAAKDEDLLGLVRRCHPDTLRQTRWANGLLKELSPQVLMT